MSSEDKIPNINSIEEKQDIARQIQITNPIQNLPQNTQINDIKEELVMGDASVGIQHYASTIGPNPQPPIHNPKSPIPNPHLRNVSKSNFLFFFFFPMKSFFSEFLSDILLFSKKIKWKKKVKILIIQ